MCCFSAATEVHGTSIFARFTKPGTQALAYQMTYAATQPTAMILPLPVATPARADSVRFTNLKEYPRLFDDLARGFPAIQEHSLFPAKRAAAHADVLAVQEVGDFIATFVPSASDFGRVDPRFVISRDVWAKIPAYADYGFAVFQLKELTGAPHPIALELETRMPASLFFPTVHIHDGTVHASDAFDHVLYAQEPAFDARASSYDGPDAVDSGTGFVRSKEKAATFTDGPRSQGLVDGSLLVHKTTLRGVLPNRDTVFDVRAIAARAQSGCARCDVAGASAGDALAGASVPVAATLAGLGWIIRRRNERPRS